MRKHIHKCLSSGIFNEFPTIRIGRKITKKTSFLFAVYCSCRMPETHGVEMIQCNNCSEWYHLDVCVKVPDDVKVSTIALQRLQTTKRFSIMIN